ncbi:MAG: hypothetical protein J6Y80_03730 [Victivallales bacterium]|nr:hypothetical protein [Victivallales bacterium]
MGDMVQRWFELEVQGAPVAVLPWKALSHESQEITVGGSRFRVGRKEHRWREAVWLECLEGEGELYAEVRFRWDGWSPKNYVLVPAAVYDGNRVEISAPDGCYPPFLPEDYVNLNPPQLTGTIQHLSRTGGGRIHLTSAECALPVVGVFDPAAREACWVCMQGNYGCLLEESDLGNAFEVRVTEPVHRAFRQVGCNSLQPAEDPPLHFHQGTQIAIWCTVFYSLKCNNLREFFAWPARLLESVDYAPREAPALLPFSEAARLVRDRLEEDNWWEEYGYYGTVTRSDLAGICRNTKHHWQLGWIGGIMKTEYLLREGEGKYRYRFERELDTLFEKAQMASGFFLTSACLGEYFADWPPIGGTMPKKGALVRKEADALAFLSRQMRFLKNEKSECKQLWLNGLHCLSEAFCGLWETYHQFGYIVDPLTGDLLVGGGAGGVLACAGLAIASEVLDEPRFLRIALESVKFYVKTCLEKGNVYGGVGDALQATDSESAYSLLESLMTVWEFTSEPELLDQACFAADYLSTWIVSSDYPFPPESTFGKLDMHSAGTVYANIQNRHAAPGFCSASGDALFKLYRATGRRVYAELACEVVRALPQYLSHPGRPIPGMAVVGMSERVNLGDWEGVSQVGEIGNAPCACWPEVSLLLARVQLPGIYARTDTHELFCFDHLEASWKGGKLRIRNPTEYPAEATLLVEDAAAARVPLKTCAYEHFRKISIPPGGMAVV